MTRAAAPFVVAVSGPGGVGKSTLVRRLAPLLREDGFAVVTARRRGCARCRREDSGDRRARTGGLGRGLREGAHGFVDAVGLSLRLAAARRRAVRLSRGRPAVVLADRGPLDGLVASDPVPGGFLARRFLRSAGRCDLTLLLEAEPDVLLARDPDHTRAGLDEAGRRYRRWAGAPATPPVRLRSGPAPRSTADEALRLVRQRLPVPGRAAGRARVVLSVFDDPFDDPGEEPRRDAPDGARRRGGDAVVVGEVARRLAEEFDVTVVTAGSRRAVQAGGRVTRRRLPVHRAGPRAGRLLFRALLPLAARRIPHDLWLESLTPPLPAGLLPLFTRAPVVGLVGDRRVRDGARRRADRVPLLLPERIGLRRYRALVVPDDAGAAALRGAGRRTAVEVIPHGVARRPDGERSHDDGFVLLLGRLDLRRKDVGLLLEAHARAGPAPPLLIAGDGTRAEERRLDRLLAREGRGGDVRRIGPVAGERRERLLAACSFVVLPSRRGGCGPVALEAMAHGKPVLHFDLPELRWTGAGGGVAVPAYDVDALARAMRRLAADSPWRRRLGRDALAASRARPWSRTTDRYLSLVRRLLDAAPPSSVPPPPRREVTSP
ncbi:glycosyltransferase [Streptomyces sp. NPDC088090]|uniref:glycosyltransferase family 4 protein n=1 Tax=Streptomyces sp. NPDC088090 TaxID=3365822 RepID=UPI00384A9D25